MTTIHHRPGHNNPPEIVYRGPMPDDDGIEAYLRRYMLRRAYEIVQLARLIEDIPLKLKAERLAMRYFAHAQMRLNNGR